MSHILYVTSPDDTHTDGQRRDDLVTLIFDLLNENVDWLSGSICFKSVRAFLNVLSHFLYDSVTLTFELKWQHTSLSC